MAEYQPLVLLIWWILRPRLMTERFQETFWSWVVRQVEKRPLFKSWLVTMFGKLEGIHWNLQIGLSKQREAEIDLCFEPKVEFYQPQDKCDLKKTFTDVENLYKERVEKK